MQTNNSVGLQLISGKVQKPQRVVIYGPEGIGKSTLAAAFPEPVFLDTEGGTIHLDVTRFPKSDTWNCVLAYIAQLRQSPHTFQTLIIDTADWLERLLSKHICEKFHKDSIEDFGYGKGYTYLAEEFSRFLQSLEDLRDQGMNIVMVAHSMIRKFEQPDAAGAYDRYELKLSKQCAPLLKEWCDILLFTNYFTKVTDNDGKKRAIGGKERRIYTTHCAAYDAKNRHDLESVLPMTFESLADVIPSMRDSSPKEHPPSESSDSRVKVREGQLKQIDQLWKQLEYGQEQMSRVFQWLEADSIEGTENWTDLTMDQAAKAIAFLSKKVAESEVNS